jgi:hypothetical protein
LRLAFFLDDTSHSGTVRAVMTCADALVERGHRTRIITTGAPVTWRSSLAEWVYVDALKQYDPAGDDLLLLSKADDLPPARELAGNRAVLLDPLPVIVDTELFRPPAAREHEPLRVLLCGTSSGTASMTATVRSRTPDGFIRRWT